MFHFIISEGCGLLFHAALFRFAAPVVEIVLKQIIVISKDLTSIKQMMGMVLGSLCTEKC